MIITLFEEIDKNEKLYFLTRIFRKLILKEMLFWKCHFLSGVIKK